MDGAAVRVEIIVPLPDVAPDQTARAEAVRFDHRDHPEKQSHPAIHGQKLPAQTLPSDAGSVLIHMADLGISVIKDPDMLNIALPGGLHPELLPFFRIYLIFSIPGRIVGTDYQIHRNPPLIFILYSIFSPIATPRQNCKTPRPKLQTFWLNQRKCPSGRNFRPPNLHLRLKFMDTCIIITPSFSKTALAELTSGCGWKQPHPYRSDLSWLSTMNI